jgi:hypothetical protein
MYITRSTLTSPLRVSGLAVVPSLTILPALNSHSSLLPAGSTGDGMLVRDLIDY